MTLLSVQIKKYGGKVLVVTNGRQALRLVPMERNARYVPVRAVSLRVIQNVFGVVFALAFCVIFYWFMSKKKESDVTVHAE